MAGIWLDKVVEMVTEDDRDKRKKVVYGLMYGVGKIRLSEICLDSHASLFHHQQLLHEILLPEVSTR